jgi:methyltransferase (TIGR00027 family)
VNEVSRTSVWVTLCRALGARESDPLVRNPDFVAERLLGPEELSLLGDSPLVQALTQPRDAALRPEASMAARLLIPRTRFIDSRLETALREGARQIVILGAGFDSRAYRFQELLARTRVFEVDHPVTQQRKMQRVRDALGSPPVNASYVAVDFRQDDLGREIAAAGYQRDEKTFFIWEGVTMYLPAEAVRGTLQWIVANSPPGSTVVFDYAYEVAIRVISNPDAFPIPPQAKQAIERFRKLIAGEPWIFGIPDRREEEFLRSLGLELRKVMGLNSPEAVQTYLTRADGSVFGGLPATEMQNYLILEAVVPERRT